MHLLMVKNPAMGGQCLRQMHLQRGQDVQELPAQGACQTTALWDMQNADGEEPWGEQAAGLGAASVIITRQSSSQC